MANENKHFDECRLCLESTESEISLFTKNVVDMVESLTSIKILKNDKLPSRCCKTCLESVHIAFRLQQRIIECDKLLQERLQCEKDEPYVETDPADSNSDADQGEVKDETDLVKVECAEVLNNNEAAKLDESETPKKKKLSKDSNEIESKDTDTPEDLDLEDSVFEIINIGDEDESSTNSDSKRSQQIFGLFANFNEQFEKKMAQKRKQLSKRSLECDRCNIKFENSRLLQAHMSKHKFKECSICNSSIRADNFKRHFELHSASKEICEICGKTAKNKESLRGHMFYQHRNNAEKYKCDECNREFRYRYKYTLHVRKVHTGVRDHQCEVCGKKFFTAFDTKKHIEMTHLRARPYVCPYCVKGYSSRYALKTHIRQHTLETPYRCEICAAGFRQKVSLKTHLKSKHDIIAKNITATPSLAAPASTKEEENSDEAL